MVYRVLKLFDHFCLRGGGGKGNKVNQPADGILGSRLHRTKEKKNTNALTR